MNKRLLIFACALAVVCCSVGFALGWKANRIYAAHRQRAEPATFESLATLLLADAVVVPAGAPTISANTAKTTPVDSAATQIPTLDLTQPWSPDVPAPEPIHTVCGIAIDYVLGGARFTFKREEGLFRTQFHDLAWTGTEERLRVAKVDLREPEKDRDILLKLAQYGSDNDVLYFDETERKQNADNLNTLVTQCQAAARGEDL